MKSHEYYIERCFELALNGMGRVAPNPLVGCVIVKNDLIIGEGCHQSYGQAHAEVNAAAHAASNSLLEGATVYVNLEPCSHFGKTPPCCDLLIQKKIKRVVVSNLDPNPLVAGKGISRLKDAGIEVIIGVLEKKGYELNRRFFTFITRKRPYIILKWAQTLDGFMDVDRTESPKADYWISNREAKVLVHKWRGEESAIMVGKTTVQNDNPQLNVRLWQGKDPVRITFDRNQTLSKDLHFFDKQQPTIIYTGLSSTASEEDNLSIAPIPFQNPLTEVCNDLFLRGIQSVIVEGGKTLLESCIEQNLWDEARLFIGNITFQKGLPAPKLLQPPSETISVKDNHLLIYKNNSPC